MIKEQLHVHMLTHVGTSRSRLLRVKSPPLKSRTSRWDLLLEGLREIHKSLTYHQMLVFPEMKPLILPETVDVSVVPQR